MKRKTAYRTTMPFDGGLSPLTDKSHYSPMFGGTPLIQDILNGGGETKGNDIHGRGNWGEGKDVSKNYRESPDEYMREQQSRAKERERALVRMRGKRKHEWVIEMEDGKEREFLSQQEAIQAIQDENLKYRRLKRRYAASQPSVIEKAMASCVEIISESGSGSEVGAGFCVGDGIYLTCAHVVGSNETAYSKSRLTLVSSEESVPATLLTIDSAADIAVLRSDLKLTPLRLGMSINYKIGEAVFAVGSPRGVGNVVSDGIISAKARKVFSEPNSPLFMFTDALVAPGNSGGPLISYASGRVVGMMAIIFGTEDNLPGLNGAIPSEYLQKMLKDVGEG